MGDEEVRTFVLHLLRQKKLSASSLVVTVSALRFFYEHVLRRPIDDIKHVQLRSKTPVSRPQVYSVEELERFFAFPGLNRKHRVMFMTTYAAGLRVKRCQDHSRLQTSPGRLILHTVRPIRIDGFRGDANCRSLAVVVRWSLRWNTDRTPLFFSKQNWQRSPPRTCRKSGIPIWNSD